MSQQACDSFLSKSGYASVQVLSGLPRDDEFNWTCGGCGRQDRWMRRLRCECGRVAPMRSLKRALRAKQALAAPQTNPPWQAGVGKSFSETLRQGKGKKSKKGAKSDGAQDPPKDKPAANGAPSESWFATFLE